FQPVLLGDGRKQIVYGSCTDRREHFAALLWTLREIAHQAEASFSEMNAWYAAASIRPETSAGLASLTLISHAAPCGSELTVSGALESAAFVSVTSPDTGA